MLRFLVALVAGAAAFMAVTFTTQLLMGGMANAGQRSTTSVALGVCAAVLTTWMMWRGGQRGAGGIPRAVVVVGLLAAGVAFWSINRPR